MAALNRVPSVRVRAAAPGEGAALARLWRELWEAHEAWGGYGASRDARVYAELADRLDGDAHVRAGDPLLGRHVHLVAELGGAVCGQVEGWVDRCGVDPLTPFTCEVRSLVVARDARRRGVGRALLDGLSHASFRATHGAPRELAAEVLVANPAAAFYDDLVYGSVAHCTRIDVAVGAAIPADSTAARLASRRDAGAVACLEQTLAARRHAAGDRRYDPPSAIDPATVAAIEVALEAGGESTQRDPTSLVAVDASGKVCGAASFAVHPLEPPFAPGVRALAGRFAVGEGRGPRAVLGALVGLAARLAAAHGATSVELTDLSEPGSDLYDATIGLGARPWSRVVTQRSRD
ncbi:MAG: GNAT family N-acetyltransferase [Polyangiaceae bacterium]